MAERKKRTSKKNTGDKKAAPPSEGGQIRNKGSEDPVNQFWSIILFTSGILVFLLAVIAGSSGWNKIHNVLRGLFGVSVFLVPVILIYTSILIAKQRSHRTVYSRAVWGGVLILLSSSVVQVIFAGMPQGNKLEYLYETGLALEGGGVLSIVIALPLMEFFGIIGARIIVCLMLFIALMLLSNLTLFQLFDYLTKPFRKMKEVVGNIREENRAIEEYEEWEYDVEQEAINLANSEPERSDMLPPPDYNINMRVPEDDLVIDPPDFKAPEWSGDDSLMIDVPISSSAVPSEPGRQSVAEPGDQSAVQAAAKSGEAPEKAESDPISELDAIVNKAVKEHDKNVMPESFAQKAQRAEEDSQKTA